MNVTSFKSKKRIVASYAIATALFPGWGIYRWEHGDVFEGLFENDTKTDKGIYTWANGEIKAGNIVKCIDGKYRILQ